MGITQSHAQHERIASARLRRHLRSGRQRVRVLGVELPGLGSSVQQQAGRYTQGHTSLVGDHGYEPCLVPVASPSSMPSSGGGGEGSLRREWLAEPEFKECLRSLVDTDFEKMLWGGEESHTHTLQPIPPDCLPSVKCGLSPREAVSPLCLRDSQA